MALRLGSIGLGRAAMQMLPSIAAHAGCVVVAAADPDASARERFRQEFGADAYGDAESMCRRAGIDAVYIASPHQYHTENILIAARYGIHVLVEKPMALRLSECRQVEAAVARSGIVLVVGHTHGFDPAVSRIHDIVMSGELGRVRMVTNFVSTDFLYRARRPEELDSERGGGIMYNQVPHQIEIARAVMPGDATVRAVRAVLGVWDADRPTEGAMCALLDFADGAAASLIYNGYDRFDSDELHWWIGEFGDAKEPKPAGSAKRALHDLTRSRSESAIKADTGFAARGLPRARGADVHHPHFGFLLVSCERGDLRPSPDGVLIYDDAGTREITLERGRAYPNKDAVIDELYAAIVDGVRPRHDAAWGSHTVAVTEALIASGRERREIELDALLHA